MVKVALLVIAATLVACTVDSLKPGVPRGITESGFMKTTEGLSMTVPDRTYDEVWAAAEQATPRHAPSSR